MIRIAATSTKLLFPNHRLWATSVRGKAKYTLYNEMPVGVPVASEFREIPVPGSPITAADLDLTWWAPTSGIYHSLDFFHNFMPWWGSIALVTIAGRLLMMPLVVYHHKNNMRLNRVLPELLELLYRQRIARRHLNEYEMFMVNYEMDKLKKKMKMNPLRVMSPAHQIPLFLAMFWPLFKIADYPIYSMKNEGLFWFKDLTMADPYYILPIVMALSIVASHRIALHYGSGSRKPIVQLYVWPAIALIAAAGLPASVQLSWTLSAIFSTLQFYVVNQPEFRKKANLPQVIKYESYMLPSPFPTHPRQVGPDRGSGEIGPGRTFAEYEEERKELEKLGKIPQRRPQISSPFSGKRIS